MPSLRGIEAFLYLVESGGIRAASRAMNLSVSAVSHRLRSFEAEVGVSLFERGSRSLQLTPAARKFHEELIPITRDLLAATKRLSRQSQSKVLRVEASSVLVSNWLAGRLGEWRKRHPGIRLEIRSLDSSAQGECDITIRSRYQPQGEPGEVLLFRWELTPICRPEVAEEYHLRSPDDLAEVPLLDVGSPMGGWKAWLESLGLPEDFGDRSIVLDSHDVLLDAATRGLGVAMGAVSLEREYTARGLVMPFSSIRSTLPGGAYVSGPREGERSLVASFREWLLEQGRS
jgi:LysR family glycine cleavage system transcriptional activator